MKTHQIAEFVAEQIQIETGHKYELVNLTEDKILVIVIGQDGSQIGQFDVIRESRFSGIIAKHFMGYESLAGVVKKLKGLEPMFELGAKGFN